MQHITYLNDLQKFIKDGRQLKYFKESAVNAVTSIRTNMEQIPNMLLYSKDNFMKDVYLHKLLSEYHGGKYKQETDRPSICYFDESSTKAIKSKYITSQYYIKIDMDTSNLTDRTHALNLLKRLCTNRSIDQTRLVVILDRVDNMPCHTDFALRKILENSNILFILTANAFNGLDYTLRSRCMPVNLRVDYKAASIDFCAWKGWQVPLREPVCDMVGMVISLSKQDDTWESSVYLAIEGFFNRMKESHNFIQRISLVKTMANRFHNACIPFAVLGKTMMEYVSRQHKWTYDDVLVYDIVAITAEHDTLCNRVNKQVFVYELYFLKVADKLCPNTYGLLQSV